MSWRVDILMLPNVADIRKHTTVTSSFPRNTPNAHALLAPTYRCNIISCIRVQRTHTESAGSTLVARIWGCCCRQCARIHFSAKSPRRAALFVQANFNAIDRLCADKRTRLGFARARVVVSIYRRTWRARARVKFAEWCGVDSACW